MAVDRTNSRSAHLAHPLNPAILKLIKVTIDHAHLAGKLVGLFGELAGDPLAAPILYGLDLDEFSMSPSRIPIIKEVMRHIRRNACQKLSKGALACANAEEVMEHYRLFLKGLGLENYY